MKRFWQAASVVEIEGGCGGGYESGYGVRLDDRPLNTPAKRRAIVPQRAVAEAMAAEWQDAPETIDPLAMPVTRAVNVTLDRVIAERAEVAARIAAYGQSDLVCYRADHPQGLVARQAAAWDPLIAWLAMQGAPLTPVAGIMHVAQPPESLARLAARIEALSPWELTPLHELVSLSGSLAIGLAVAEGELGAPEAWRRSRIDEDWNIEQWGEDAEAAALAARHEASFLAAARLLELVRVE
ncbi:MAG: ATP12 family protein [Pseudomonadota bacterium]